MESIAAPHDAHINPSEPSTVVFPDDAQSPGVVGTSKQEPEFESGSVHCVVTYKTTGAAVNPHGSITCKMDRRVACSPDGEGILAEFHERAAAAFLRCLRAHDTPPEEKTADPGPTPTSGAGQ